MLETEEEKKPSIHSMNEGTGELFKSHLKRYSKFWQITQNHVNDANTVNHELTYSHSLRDFE
jgi:hypothetical protein